MEVTILAASYDNFEYGCEDINCECIISEWYNTFP
ncbi:unnamed protein product [Angiostrongylus costaricensis]|uniref:Uncharacterized protein n=1 Tax=Angiostrongylus costaricensis TaxID=334426 RepID=A0A0R3PAA7_ANGCS|nr:unnamed protein product [Angiostrongylus costaricensis]